jgi:hypothetical protein
MVKHYYTIVEFAIIINKISNDSFIDKSNKQIYFSRALEIPWGIASALKEAA